jgi:hypothetical protein
MVGYRLLDYVRRLMKLRSAFLLLGLAFAWPRTAKAQLHWDASAGVGVMKRFFTQPASGQPGFGPVALLTAHVALLPLVHVGGYFGHDISTLPGDAFPRDITSGGIRAKAVLPWGARGRAWAFLGLGYAGVYARSYLTSFQVPTGLGTTELRSGRVQGAGGGFFEVPFGLGASYTLRKPWELYAELGLRVGFAHTGSVYEEPGPQLRLDDTNGSGGVGQNVAPSGIDRVALGLTLGVLLDL